MLGWSDTIIQSVDILLRVCDNEWGMFASLGADVGTHLVSILRVPLQVHAPLSPQNECKSTVDLLPNMVYNEGEWVCLVDPGTGMLHLMGGK